MPTTGLTGSIIRHPLVAYFVLAFTFAWLPVLPLTLSRNAGVGLLPYDLPGMLLNVLFVVASFIGPTLAAIVVTSVIEGRGGVKRLLKRCLQWRVRPQWYVVVLGANMLIWLLAYTALVGPSLPVALVTHWPLFFSAFLPYVAFGLLIPAIDEEPGWRGFALPRLQRQYGPLAGSLILGTLHGVWHFPALFTVLLGPFTLDQVLPFVLIAAFAAVLYTWVYNHTGGSILIAMLFHASSNAATNWLTMLFKDARLPDPQAGWSGFLARTNWLNVIAYGLAALLIIVLTRGRLGYRTDSEAALADIA
jgi:membrane protease YdiL (CAAX protease family)